MPDIAGGDKCEQGIAKTGFHDMGAAPYIPGRFGQGLRSGTRLGVRMLLRGGLSVSPSPGDLLQARNDLHHFLRQVLALVPVQHNGPHYPGHRSDDPPEVGAHPPQLGQNLSMARTRPGGHRPVRGTRSARTAAVLGTGGWLAGPWMAAGAPAPGTTRTRRAPLQHYLTAGQGGAEPLPGGCHLLGIIGASHPLDVPALHGLAGGSDPDGQCQHRAATAAGGFLLVPGRTSHPCRVGRAFLPF